ncbi:hypothetical protein F511_01390 [Dorcoceras hygrometricum]|uniref:Uncharacterized protein n=1 Tax=Dorcoceras hygrometricum TaxID=472368 RepID=A0A2Z7BHG6_9LAMI|nr:hypothetical protein F511_01390 [Dorcoceras hygrometricum]
MSKKKMNSRSLESVAQELVSAMMTSAYLLEKAKSRNSNHDVSISIGGSWIQQSLRQHICWRKLDSANLTSAYLLEETEISNTDVSIYVEEASGSTRDVIITITRAVGRYQQSANYRSCWQTSPFKREGIRDICWRKLDSAKLTSAYLLEEAGFSKAYVSISVGGSWIQQSLRQHICWRKLDSAKLTSAYLLEEAGFSKAYSSIARIWKDDDLAVTSAEEIWNLSNDYIRTEAIYLRRTPLKRVGETVSCCRITLIAQYTSRGKMNRKTKKSTAIREELSRESIAEF